MKTNRTLTTLGGLILTASLALAQVTPVAPPAPPAARAPQVAPPAPPAAPLPAPASAAAPRAFGWADSPDMVTPMALAPEIAAQISADVQLQLDKAQMDFQFQQKDWIDAQAKAAEKMAEAQSKMAAASDKYRFDAFDKSLAFQARTIFTGRGSEESQYSNGLRAIDEHQYEQALTEFNNVVSRAGSRAEGGLYWKAYVLNKLGRAADAQGAIDQLRKTYPNSRWLDDAKALELEVKQTKGPVSPDAESDEDLKILALNGLMQSDPDKALPQVEKMLQGSHSPKLKRNALTVIAQSNSPQAQQLLEKIARGSNPDIQVRAISYLAAKRDANTPKVLMEIYTSTSDAAVKQAVLNTFNVRNNRDQLFNIAKSEREGALRSTAINRLGDVDGQPELWQMYQSESTPEGKINILSVMLHNGNIDKLTEVARNDKDAKVRQKAIQVIAQQDGGNPSNVLVSLYASEQDDKVKQSIIDNVSNSRNCKPLVDLAKAETKNTQMKIRIFQRLSNMTKTCSAANDYMLEILNKI
jgi:hypothetical protein